MIQALKGFFIIIAFIITMYILAFVSGVIYIFITNTFTKEYIEYKQKNIEIEGSKGLLVLGLASVVLLICFLIGSII
jgi:hypothetical protein